LNHRTIWQRPMGTRASCPHASETLAYLRSVRYESESPNTYNYCIHHWYIRLNIVLLLALIGCGKQPAYMQEVSHIPTTIIPTAIVLPTIPLPEMPTVVASDVPARISQKMKPFMPTPSANVIKYTVYLTAALKYGQDYKNSCEFDAGWVIVQSYGFDVTVDDLISKIPLDSSIEPEIYETTEGFFIYGGDILHKYSGDYKTNFLARTMGRAFAQVFSSYGLETQPVRNRDQLETALQKGNLVWIKTTVDFLMGRPASWITPQGEHIKTVLGNDHAVVVIGYNDSVVVIRDTLGPTSTNLNRTFEYEVPWDQFLEAWGEQDFDGIVVIRPNH
jgi:hypothetical protein